MELVRRRQGHGSGSDAYSVRNEYCVLKKQQDNYKYWSLSYEVQHEATISRQQLNKVQTL